MKCRSVVSWLPGLIAVSWLVAHGVAYSQSKPIRLRNETIQTDPARPSSFLSQPAATAPTKPAAPASGLFLVQFQDPLQPGWRVDLAAMGVELLRYVPEDAFIARLANTDLDRVRALTYVRWVGDFRPEHKLHGQLLQQARASAMSLVAANNPVEISILTTPHANRFEVAQLRRLLTFTKQESRLRQGTVLRGTILPNQLPALAQMRTVLWVEPAPRTKLFDEAASKIVGGDDGQDGTPTLTQQLGFGGAGVTVSVADTGLNNGDIATMHPDLFGRVDGFLYYGSLTDAADEHGHGTHVAGIIAGNAATGEANGFGDLFGLGVASQAHIFSQRIFDGLGNFEAPPSNETLTRDAVRNGAVIGSNSWGDDTQGRYDLSAAEFDELVRDADALAFGDQPYILEFSAGNAGPGAQTIGSPAVAKNVIATGASQNNFSDLFIYEDGQEAMADFSSRGPAEDGRIKPDVVAPGTWIASLQSASATSDNAWEPIDQFYQYEGGTSQAGPHVSGAAAVFVQYYRSQHTNATPSPALVKAALINSAVNMDDNFGTGPIPNMDEGWGRVDLTQIIGSPKHFEYVDQTDLLSTGQVYEHHTFVASAQQPLKITMTYTDVPGFPGAIPALVNNLDLEVVGPNGTVYLGNQMDQGESVPNAAAADNLNNVEEVHLSAPLPGDYTVRVRALNVVDDARLDTPAIDQDFALVISGDIPPANLGIVALDRGAYTAPDRIGIQVRDLDQAGHASASVLLHSTTESKESILLLPAAGPGIFTNSVQTAVGPPAPDGKLQIHHGDVIEARYVDVSAGVTRTAQAVADLFPPIISNIGVTNLFNQMVITWTTDEPSRSIVRYSTNLSLNLSATNTDLTTNHTVFIRNYKGGATYNFIVISSDEAGNTATNNTGGPLLTFVGAPPATVLLVDAYVPDADSTVIPVSTYTDALTAAGISFNVWNVTQHGNSPALSLLKAFPVVIWRVSDSLYTDSPNSTLSSSDQNNLTQYVNSGGGFFMSSMETLSRIGDVPFRRNVLQVANFTTNPDPFSICTDCDEDVGVPSIQGAGNDPVSSGVNALLDYSNYPEIDLFGTIIGPDLSDTFTPATNAVTVLREPSSGKTVGIRYPRTGKDSAGRVVFCAFPFDTIPAAGPDPNNRANIMRNIISFLAPGANGLGAISLDNSLYPVPGLVTVEVGDDDLAELGQATVTFTSTSQTNPVTITLNETVRPGLFRGYVSLVPTNITAGPGQLRARNGDAIIARYFDASANGTVQVAATVDTLPATISGVTADPGYQDAVVSWTTSEPADSLVQYGESVLLGRTAYSANLDIDHAVTLQGLLTDHDYYFRVVSRDQAGNTTVNDNQGQPYVFHTLLPKRPPFFDDMEHGPTNWTVIDADGTQVSWTLGQPNNGRETNGRSPTNAWGSNLHGDSTGSVESYLVSPAIELVGGSQATLEFWHSYDFTALSDFDLLEYGEVLVLTNTTSQPIVLATFDQFSDSYEQVTLDLTPYLGKVVYLAWHYLEFSLQDAPRPGWLVDDVSVTVTNAPVGTIVVTNNLAEGLFAVSGPMNRNGSGMMTTISNAPPGQYVAQFGSVPYYQTPANLTNSLVAGTTLTFSGNYTFVDANHNGIPDAWEMQYFGTVSTNRTALTDTDGDGMTDRAEFIAGTDPTNAASKLSFILPFNRVGNAIQLQWSAVPGRLYRLETSTNMTSWTAVTAWMAGSSSSMSYTVTNQPADRAHLFRVRVQN